MKFKNIIRYTAALAFPVALLGGCTGDFEELNTNPIEVNPSDLPFEAQFLEPMSYSYPNQQNLFQYWTNLQIDIFGGYFESPNGNFTNQRYDINRGHCGGMYENFMLHIINNTGRLIKQCDAEGKFDFSATMRIVQTYNLLDFTDAYGPVPFLSVFKTAGDPVQPSSFAYDTQKAVYEAMLEDLDTRDACIRVRQCVGECLNPRERAIITLRYGLDDQPPRTQREVAARCGISRSYVSRIEKRALAKLEQAMDGWRP